jgi:hypothetical protein
MRNRIVDLEMPANLPTDLSRMLTVCLRATFVSGKIS